MGKRGPAPRPASELRGKRVSVYFTDEEIKRLDDLRGGRSRGRYVRDAALKELPAFVPAINREAWSDLAKVSTLLKRYVVAIDVGKAGGMPPEIITNLRDQVQLLRQELLGIKSDDDADDEESSEAEVW